MRAYVASLATETNTFSPLYVDRSAFEGAFYCLPGQHPATPTLCSAPVVAARSRAREGAFELVEGTATWAEPAGPIARAAYEGLRDQILAEIEAAMPLDIVLFGLHGSMVAVGYDDCEGDLLARARAIVGERCVIGAELDLHAHLTDAMMEAATLIVSFKEFPHTDFLARAEDLVELAIAAARGTVDPVKAVFDCRAIGGFMTSREPGRSFVDRLIAMEAQGEALSISVVHGFPAADVADVGLKVLVTTDGDAAKAAALARSLGEEILGWGGTGVPPHLKPDEVVAHARSVAGRPVVFADRWDNPGGGVAGDATIMVETLLAHPDIPAAIGALWDPVAVAICRAAGPGTKFKLRFGGKAAATSGRPVDAEVEVIATTEDLLVPFEQSVVSLGPAVSLAIGSLAVVLSSTRAQTFSPDVFTKLGIDLAAREIVVVKSSNHFYAAFAPIAADIAYLDTGGPYPSDPSKIPYTKIRRPIWPLDDMSLVENARRSAA